MKVFVFLAVLGVCYSAKYAYKCNKGADWATASAANADQACETKEGGKAADAKCSRPAFMEVRDNKYKKYDCGACADDKTDKECVTCTNDAQNTDTPCNTESPAPTHAYMCTQYEMKSGATEYTEAADKTKCMVALAATDAEVKATEACRKPVDGYKKPSTVADDKELINPCGKCSALTNAELQKNTICVDYTAGAATMSFMLAPLLAVLFWLH